MYIYPEDRGFWLKKKSFSKSGISNLKSNLPEKIIIRVYGMAGVGKGTLGRRLSSSLGLLNLDTGLLWRAVTHLAQLEKMPLSQSTLNFAFDSLELIDIDDQMQVLYKGKILTPTELRKPSIDANVSQFASFSKQARDTFDQKIYNFIKTSKKRVLSDGRGANEAYVLKAQEDGYMTIRLLLTAKLEVKVKRRYLDYLAKEQLLNSKAPLDSSQNELIYQKAKELVMLRDAKDLQNINEKGLGLISDDTGVIDTSEMSKNEVFETTLSFIHSKVHQASK